MNRAKPNWRTFSIHYGEERRARAVARAVIEARRRQPFETTKQLADLVSSLSGRNRVAFTPRRACFRDCGSRVNDELGELVRAFTRPNACFIRAEGSWW